MAKAPRPQNKNLRPNRKGEPKRGGRKKGTPNKITVSMKEAVLNVFNQIGGELAFANYAKKNLATKKVFYGIASKLIPTEVVGAGGGALIPQTAEVHVHLPDNSRPSEADKDKAKSKAGKS